MKLSTQQTTQLRLLLPQFPSWASMTYKHRHLPPPPHHNTHQLHSTQVFHIVMAWISSRIDKNKENWKEEFFSMLKEFWEFVHTNMLCEGDFAKSLVASNTFPREYTQDVFPSIDMRGVPCYYIPLAGKDDSTHSFLRQQLRRGEREKGKEKEGGEPSNQGGEDRKRKRGKEREGESSTTPVQAVEVCAKCKNTGYVRCVVVCPHCSGNGCMKCYFSRFTSTASKCDCVSGNILVFKDFFQQEFIGQHLRIKNKKIAMPSLVPNDL